MGLKHLNIFRYKKQDVSWTSTKKTALDYNDKPTTTKNKTIMIKKKKKKNQWSGDNKVQNVSAYSARWEFPTE